MARYIVGIRPNAKNPNSELKVYERPPSIYQPRDRRGKLEPERFHWPGAACGFRAERGHLRDDRTLDERGGRLIVARVFPEEAAAELNEHNERIAQAEHALRAAKQDRQDLLDTLVPRAARVNVEAARADLEMWKQSEAAKQEEAKRAAESAAAAKATRAMNRLFDDFVGKAVR